MSDTTFPAPFWLPFDVLMSCGSVLSELDELMEIAEWHKQR